MAGLCRNNFTNENGRCNIHEAGDEGLFRVTFSRIMRKDAAMYMKTSVWKASKRNLNYMQEMFQNRLQEDISV